MNEKEQKKLFAFRIAPSPNHSQPVSTEPRRPRGRSHKVVVGGKPWGEFAGVCRMVAGVSDHQASAMVRVRPAMLR